MRTASTCILSGDFLYPGHSRHRMHGPPNQTGGELESALLAAVGRAGIDLVTSAHAEDLFADPDGRVVAIAFRRRDGAMEVVGCGSIVLACNGFGGNPEMVRRYIPEIADAPYLGHPGNQGDAVRWSTDLGAATADMEAYQGHGSVAQPHGILLTWAVVTEGGIQVNADGLRFGNKSPGCSEFAVQVQRRPGKDRLEHLRRTLRSPRRSASRNTGSSWHSAPCDGQRT